LADVKAADVVSGAGEILRHRKNPLISPVNGGVKAVDLQNGGGGEIS
jgi:hypothetical protein